MIVGAFSDKYLVQVIMNFILNDYQLPDKECDKLKIAIDDVN